MALTKAQFRERLRDEIGDPLRIDGTATGGSLTTIVDTVKLTQIDNHWQKLWAFIIDTNDDAVPKGQARFIERSTNATKELTMELPFSAAVQAGDTYGIAVFANARLDNMIAQTLLDFSDYRPLKFSESLAVTANEKRFAPTSAAVIRYVEMIEEYQAGVTDQRYVFTWNKSTRKVEFPVWFGENKTLTLYAAKSHTLPASDGDAMTYEEYDESRLLRWCAANMLLSVGAAEFHDSFGQLQPKSWTTGDVSKTFGDSREKMFEHLRQEIDAIKKSFGSGMVLNMSNGNASAGNLKIDYHGDPDGWIPPATFWTLQA